MWFRVDDGLFAHRKVRKIRRDRPDSPRDIAPMGLWVIGGSWCSSHSPEGFIPLEVLEDYDDNAQELAQRLVDAGMWVKGEVAGETGYYFHDWDDFRPDSAKSSDSGKRGNHVRWHQQRGVVDPECDLCQGTGAADYRPDSPPDRLPDSPPDRLPGPSRPDPSRPDRTRDKLAAASFKDFWKTYPRKEGKGAAEKAWTKAVKSTDPTEIITALKEQLPNLAMRRRTDGDFRPYPATWLNQKRWEDETPEPAVAVGESGNGYGGPAGSAWGMPFREPSDDE